MLIVQIALGIVLAVVLLAFLPQIFSISIWVALAAVAFGLVAVGFLFFLDNPVLVGLLIAISIGGYFIIKTDAEGGNEEEKQRRKALGYED